VTPGATVTVRNEDGAPHTLTAVDGSFSTPIIEAGGEATFQAPIEPGSYPITCQIHSFMSGTLVVAEEIPPPGDGTPTPTASPTAVSHHGG
jgi:plastocyanin